MTIVAVKAPRSSPARAGANSLMCSRSHPPGCRGTDAGFFMQKRYRESGIQDDSEA